MSPPVKLGSFDAKALHTYEGGQQVDFGGVRGLAISGDGGSVAGGGLHKATNPPGAVHEPLVLVFDGKSRSSPGPDRWDRGRSVIGGSVTWPMAADGADAEVPTAACCSSGSRASTRTTIVSHCRISSGIWISTPMGYASSRPITTAMYESLDLLPERADRRSTIGQIGSSGYQSPGDLDEKMA